MKKVSLLLFLAAFFVSINAQTTVNVATAGSLDSKGISASVTDLIITGTLNAKDFNYIKNTLSSLISIDISGINIAAYKGTEGTKGTTVDYDYAANEIPDMSFQSKSALTTVTLPGSITSIGANAFYNDRKITSISIPSSVVKIGNMAFNQCFALSSVVFSGDNLVSIGNSTFRGCNFTSITLPASVSTIDQSAFTLCQRLKSITIPDAVTEITTNAFLGCIALESITIPNKVLNVRANAFSGCTAMTSLHLGVSGQSGVGLNIETGAFNNCTSLMNIYINNRTSIPTATETTFTGVPTGVNGCVVTATCGSVAAFAAAPGWNAFIINAPTGISNTTNNELRISRTANGFSIDGTSAGDIYTVYTANGKCILKGQCLHGKTNLSLNSKGVYVLSIGTQQPIKLIY